MSRIPDCRTDENYNIKYLNETDKAEVSGYDYCAEHVVDNFFYNLDVYYGGDNYFMHVMNEEIPESMREEYAMEYSDGSREDEKRTVKTYGDLLRCNLLDWIESERDQLITSIIDGYTEEEYKAIKERVDANE
jgi:hypothetical protein